MEEIVNLPISKYLEDFKNLRDVHGNIERKFLEHINNFINGKDFDNFMKTLSTTNSESKEAIKILENTNSCIDFINILKDSVVSKMNNDLKLAEMFWQIAIDLVEKSGLRLFISTLASLLGKLPPSEIKGYILSGKMHEELLEEFFDKLREFSTQIIKCLSDEIDNEGEKNITVH